MNKKMVFGQYVDTNSWIHRLDPRTKIIVLFLLMIGMFLIKNIFVLLGLLIFIYLIVITTKIPIRNFLNSFKPMVMLLVFTVIFQIVFNTSGEVMVIETFGKKFEMTWNFNFSILAIISILLIIIIYIMLGKITRKYRLLLFFVGLFLAFYVQNTISISYSFFDYKISIHEDAFLSSIRVLLRIINLISLSALLTFSTKPMELNNGIEGLFKPFKFMRKSASILGMLISIALRFIPTLIDESQKILKAQASRGVDFNESSLKEKVVQIIALLVPMLVVSYKRAEDLANAMDARGYIPGATRTSINVLKYNLCDYLCYIFLLVVYVLLIVGKIWGNI